MHMYADKWHLDCNLEQGGYAPVQSPMNLGASISPVNTISVKLDANTEVVKSTKTLDLRFVDGRLQQKFIVERTALLDHGYPHTETFHEWREVETIDDVVKHVG